MIYDLSNDLHKTLFTTRVKMLMKRGSVIELAEKSMRTRGQNSYLHLLIGVVAMETGNTLDYCKQYYFKRLCNKDIFVKEVDDKFLGHLEVVRSSADLTSEEMSMAIDRFKRWGNENGIYMPAPGDESLLKYIAVEMGRMKQYL